MKPSSLQVGPFRYGIWWDQEMKRDLGTCDHNHLQIKIAAQPKDNERETLLHEALHAVLDSINVRDMLSPKQEEQLVSRLSPPLLDMLRRNPEFTGYLVA